MLTELFDRAASWARERRASFRDAVVEMYQSGLAARVGLGLAVGAAGGLVAHALHLPLAFMLGSLFACMAASIAGLPVASTQRLRMNFLVLIGLFLGESFDANSAADMARWPLTILLACLYVFAAGWAAYVIYTRFAGMDRLTAFFSSIPGGLSGAVMTASALGAEERAVTLTQSLRIALIVLAAPAIFFGVISDAEAPTLAGEARPMVNLREVAMLSVAAFVGIKLFERLGVPIAPMIGAMAGGACLRLFGVVEGALPVWLVEAALVVTGSSLGCRFRGADPRALLRLVGWTALGSSAMALMSAAFALAAAPIAGVSYPAALLAFMPGGVAEMCVIALALEIEPSFVATHHMARIFFIMAMLPAVAWALSRRRGGGP